MSSSPLWVTALIELPIYYNPDETGPRQQIDENKFQDTYKEISLKFGGCIVHPMGKGFWWDRGVYWEDDMVLVEVDVPDEEESRIWLLQYLKNTLLQRFKQEAIYIKWIKMVDVMIVRVSK